MYGWTYHSQTSQPLQFVKADSMDPFEEKRSMLHFIEDQVEWTEEKYSLTSFRENGRFKLPTLIHITSGYFGKDDSDTFSSDDILVLYEWKLQERVLAKRRKVSISIPLDFEYKLEVLEPGMPSRLMHLSQIVQKYNPPVQVRFGPDTNVSFTLGQKEVNTEEFGPFTLMSSHFLEYATASTTVKGTIFTEELVCLPIYRKVRFVVATRLHGIPIEHQSHHFHSFLEHMETTHMLGILEYTELLDTMEEYDYVKTIPSGTWGKPQNDLVHTNNNGQYTLLKKEDPVTDYEPIETNHRAKEKVTSSVPVPGKYSPIMRKGSSKHPQLPIELPNRMKRDDIYILTDIHISPENEPLFPFAIPKSPIFGETGPRPTSPSGPIHGKQRPVAPVSPRPFSPSISNPSKRDLTIAVVPQAPPLFPHSSAKPKVPPPVSPKPLSPIPNKPASPSREALGLNPVTGSWVTNSTPNLSHPEQRPLVSAFIMPIHEERRHTIADSTSALFPSVEASQIKGSVLPHPLVIHTLEDVPADLTDLSVDQVCHCLALLNLGEFGPRFRHALIDGRILRGCSAEGLKQEFSMGHLSARKLAMFANDGWRPKE